MGMTRAETWLSVMPSPVDAIVTMLSLGCISSEWIGRKKVEGAPISKMEVLTLAGVSPGSGVLHQEF